MPNQKQAEDSINMELVEVRAIRRNRASGAILGGLAAVAASFAFTATAHAAEFAVACGDVSGPQGLLAAIDAANATPGPSTIDLQGCTYTLPAPAATADSLGPDGLPVVTGALTINGQGATIVRSPSASVFRILHVAPGAVVDLSGLTISGGDSAILGGGVLNEGELSVADSQITANTSNGGGGGIGNRPGSSLTITDSVISGNSTPGPNDGGGIATGGALRIEGSVLTGNSAGAAGGAIESFGTLEISNSELQYNSAALAGAILDQSGATVNRSSLTENQATGGPGGGLYVQAGDTATLTAVSLTDNQATGVGGGAYLEPGAMLSATKTGIHANTSAVGGGGVFDTGATVDLTTSMVTGNKPDNCEPLGSVTGCS